MRSDYDAPRAAILEPPTEGLELLREARYAGTDPLDPDFAASYEFAEEFTTTDDGQPAPIIPIRADEFRCTGCFLVLHRGLRASGANGKDICRDCA